MTGRADDVRAAWFAEHRNYLFAVAYRILGVAEDAEDVLQDAWLRFAAVPVEEVERPRAYLVTVVTRLAIDALRSARRQREEYVGVWLPEPVPREQALPEDIVEQAESASFAFLLLLERLNPVERAALVLHDVFDYSHNEVAEAIDRSPAATRQALRRARLKLGGATRPRGPANEQALGLLTIFLDALRTGDVGHLVSSLASDVVLMSDGGGRVNAANRPLAGASQVARFLIAMRGMAPADDAIAVAVTELNGQPALTVTLEGTLDSAFLFDATSEGITAIYVVRNPEKLARLAGTA
ncbi:MAG: RNA polymerase sigma factor SigJ [Dehalococcoidia bacterium]